MSLPAFSGLFAKFIAAVAAAPDENPTCKITYSHIQPSNGNPNDLQENNFRNSLFNKKWNTEFL